MIANSRLKRLIISLVVLFFIASGLALHRGELTTLALENTTAQSVIKNGITMAKEEIYADREYPVYVQFDSPSNSTLGFQTIQYINLDYRYDRDDSMVLQSLVSGIKPVKFPAVSADTLREQGITPISNDLALKDTQIACFRSHANLWSKMIQENWKTMLILEADATWDVNVKAMMKRFSAALNELFNTSPAAKYKGSAATENDPYLSDNWDIISLGHCFDGQNFYTDNLVYKDIDTPTEQNFFGRRLNGQRVVRRSGGPACTTAYALSQSGARKLLLRNALDYNKPVDLVISDLVSSEQLLAYSSHPSMFAQLAYKKGLGADSQNSDIDLLETIGTDDYKQYKEKWRKVHEDRNIWDMSEIYQGSRFKRPAFDAINEKVYGDIPNNLESALWWPDEDNGAVVVVETVVEVVAQPNTAAVAPASTAASNGSTDSAL